MYKRQLVACGGGGEDFANDPPEIIFGQDVCSECNMIINEANFAAAYWTCLLYTSRCV